MKGGVSATKKKLRDDEILAGHCTVGVCEETEVLPELLFPETIIFFECLKSSSYLSTYSSDTLDRRNIIATAEIGPFEFPI